LSLAAGGRLGPYEIVAAIGAGGMGEVYRARDGRLHRDVAIKVLPDLFARDPERLARFEREAQVLASLNHPNIAHVYGVESGALVMELVDGEDLSQTITRGPMPVRDALPIAKQIADALEAAHEQGIIHRDLKPANVKLRADGAVKVLDFGLAKATDVSPSSMNAMQSPTLTARATQLGVIIGTAAYMSPEQARGKNVDKRADIWAFGVVLYELLTGKRLFSGTETTDVLAKILERDPDWSALPPSTPPAVRNLLERCLAKDPKARLRDIGEARHTLDEVIAGRSGSSAIAVPAPVARQAARVPAWLPWVVAGACAAAAGYAWLRPNAPPARMPTTRVELRLPDNVEFYTAPRISVSGRRIAFVGSREGTRTMYVRDLNQAEPRPIGGTDGCIFVALSPDDHSAAIIAADAKLKRVNIDAGGAEDLATEVDVVGGLQWTRDDKILFGRVTELLWIPASGGVAKTIVKAQAPNETLTSPLATPDGRTVIFTSVSGTPGNVKSRIEAVGIDGSSRHLVLETAGYTSAVSANRLIFQRETSIYAAPFDSTRAIVTGPPVKLTDEARISPTGGLAADVSAEGDILFADVRATSGRLAWVSLEGTERPLAMPAHNYGNPRVSPDGRTIAYSDSAAVWTADTERGSQTRIFSGADSLTGYPAWSPDGSQLYFRTASGVMRIRADGEGKPELIPGTKRNDYPNGVSPDGSILLTTRIEATSSGDVMLVPTRGGGEPRALVSTPAYEGGAQFSPDGKWITYVSNTSSRMEVYLRPVNGEERFSVSTAGGLGPIWSRDGRHIYFRSALQFFVVDVATEPAVSLSAPKLLFERRYAFGANITIANYSLNRDGKEFLLVTTGPSHLSLIFNWLESAGR
jgi:Tol biopolymer transport system component